MNAERELSDVELNGVAGGLVVIVTEEMLKALLRSKAPEPTLQHEAPHAK